MCTTAWCYGDCEECLEEKARKQAEEDSECCRFSPGPYVPQSQCGLQTIDVKTDACRKCGFIQKY